MGTISPVVPTPFECEKPHNSLASGASTGNGLNWFDVNVNQVDWLEAFDSFGDCVADLMDTRER